MIFLKRISALFATLIFLVNVNAASAPVVIANNIAPVIVLTIPQKIAKYAKQYNVSAEIMTNVTRCESSFNPKAVGDNNTSFGLSQIHLPAHPEVTKEMAFDEDYAIEFMARGIASGHLRWWSCARILGY